MICIIVIGFFEYTVVINTSIFTWAIFAEIKMSKLIFELTEASPSLFLMGFVYLRRGGAFVFKMEGGGRVTQSDTYLPLSPLSSEKK